MIFYKFVISVCLTFLFTQSLSAQNNMYWVGGSGDWSDINHWAKTSGGSVITGSIPTEYDNAIIDQNSGLNTSSIITISPGTYHVNDLIISNSWDFTLLFNGTSAANDVEMNVHGNIDLHQNMKLEYSSNTIFNNKWKFVGANIHDIYTGYNDLLNVEFFTEGATYNLLNHFTASLQIRMHAGIWNTNGRDVTTGYLYFRDTQPSNAPYNKVLNAGSSNIMCDEWDSKLVYGSLVVTGSHIIKTKKFTGSPKQGNTAFSYNEIHLLEYQDTPVGAAIEDNNFECRSCIIQTIIVEDTGNTKFADKFTLNGNLTIVNPGSSILFNGGNSRISEVTFNGDIITPSLVNCNDPRTIFSTVYTNETVFKRDIGTLLIKEAVINNVTTEGNGIFELSDGMLQGSSIGWNLTNNPTPISYYWKRTVGIGDWNNPANWVLQNGNSNGCLPSLVDDVYIDNLSMGNIRIPSAYNAVCRNFTWTNNANLELILDGTTSLQSVLTITGDFELNVTASITPVMSHEICFSSTTDNTFQTNGVNLPEIKFVGDLGIWNLLGDLTTDRFYFEGGTLNTQNNSIETDDWLSIGQRPKQFNLGSSHITVNGEMNLAPYANSNVTVLPGTSLIECQKLTSTVETLYDVQLNNSSNLTMGNYNYSFHNFILYGSGAVTIVNDMTLENLVFKASNSTLILDLFQTVGSNNYEYFTVNGGISSNAISNSPAVIRSATSGTRMYLTKTLGNLCILGYIEIQDIGTVMTGIANAPRSTDIGNNMGINFDAVGSSTDLFWVGNTGEWALKNNWSSISGGCPASKAPSDAVTLIFDNYSFISSSELVTVTGTTYANDIEFRNNNYAANIQIEIQLSADNLSVINGSSHFSGKNLFINEEVLVDSSGYLSTDMYGSFNTPKFELLSGLFILKKDSNMKVTN